MSRTYRARGSAQWKARKWVDSGCGVHFYSHRSLVAGVIAHRFYNVPCLIKDQPVIKVDRNSYKNKQGRTLYWEEHVWRSHEECLHPIFGRDVYDRVSQLIRAQQGVQSTLPLWQHPYAGRGRSYRFDHKWDHRAERKGSRRRMNVYMSQLPRTDDACP